MDKFHIEATRLYWLNDDGTDDPTVLCLHGHVIARFGSAVLEDDCTVSATALRLLKTLEEDHPYIGGCFDGTDWAVLHDDGGIRIVLADGREFSIDPDEYRAEVFRFADAIKAYYDSCLPKILPNDEFSRNGYIAFWNEWQRRRHPQ